ncbi:MAG: replication initiator protein A [Methylococcaceae bacterium]|nr:replication initiator protein A [Methylococcaceae bacterium]
MADFLASDKHKQTDFFICDVFDTYKDDSASMEHPVFSLSTKPDHRMLVYQYNGNTIKIKPSYTGLATIHDKDILLYLTSCLMNAKNNGERISSRVRFTAYDYLNSTNKTINGKSYIQLKDGLERLSGTRIETDIKTNDKEVLSEFGLIDSWHIVKEGKDGRMVAVEVVLSDWFYNSVLGNAVLSIDKDYFKLRKPTERRLYEIARKHCGNQVVWKISLDKLKDKIGSNSPLNKLRFNINKVAETNHLPEYNISMNDDIVMFTRKEPPKENKAPAKLPKHVTEKEIKQHARPGEKTEEVKQRLIKAMKDAVR